MEFRSKQVRKVMYVQPTFDSIEQEYGEEQWKDPGPGLARQATEFVLSQLYTRSYDDVMEQPTAQEQHPRTARPARTKWRAGVTGATRAIWTWMVSWVDW